MTHIMSIALCIVTAKTRNPEYPSSKEGINCGISKQENTVQQ